MMNKEEDAIEILRKIVLVIGMIGSGTRKEIAIVIRNVLEKQERRR